MPSSNTVMRQLKSCALALLMLSGLSFAIDQCRPNESTATLSATEAQILVYVSPVGERLRARGSDIAMEQQTSPQLNQADYYYFWLYNAKRQSNGSVTVGYYAVNKHTADLWDTDDHKRISSKLLLDVQRIIRKALHINEDAIQKYRSRPF